MADDQVHKSYIIPPVFRMNGRVPGQVPTKKRMRTLGQVQALSRLGARSPEGASNLNLGRLAGQPVRTPVPRGDPALRALTEMPGDMTEERLLEPGTSPVLRPVNVVADLGLPAGEVAHWTKFLGKAVRDSANEVVFRKAVYEKLMESGFEGPARRTIFARAMKHWRTVQKSLIDVHYPDGSVRKALYIGPKGGRWADAKHTIPYDAKKHGPKAKGKSKPWKVQTEGALLFVVNTETGERKQVKHHPSWPNREKRAAKVARELNKRAAAVEREATEQPDLQLTLALEKQAAPESQATVATAVTYYASGANRASDIRGFDEANHPIGIVATEVMGRETPIEELLKVKVPVFVDSGAFSEVEFTDQGPQVVNPITAEQWEARLDFYQMLADKLGGQVTVVAPDMIAHPQETLARLQTYRERIHRLVEAGARVLVPLQGADKVDFYARALAVLKLKPGDVTPALPMNKNATTAEEVLDFVRRAKPHGLHLLGVSPVKPAGAELVAAIRELAGDIEVSGDSNRITAKIGTRKRPGPLMVAKDKAAEELAEYRWSEGAPPGTMPGGRGPVKTLPGDYTDLIATPSEWLAGPALQKVARAMGLSDEETTRWLADPDAFLQEEGSNGEPRYLDPQVAQALDAAWAQRHEEVTAPEKQRRAIREVFTIPAEPAPEKPEPVQVDKPPAAKRKPATRDEKLKDGLEVEGYARAGTPAAFELIGPHDHAYCTRCGAQIGYVFVTNKGPMGGDCLATLTGDNSTRRLVRKVNESFRKTVENLKAYKGGRVRRLTLQAGFGGQGVVLVAQYIGERTPYNEHTGTYQYDTQFVTSVPDTQAPMLLAIAASLADNNDLEFVDERLPTEATLPKGEGEKSMRFTLTEDTLQKARKYAGPFVGPRGGLWADPQHTIPWRASQHGKPGQKIFVIDRSKAAPGNEAREAEALVQDRKQVQVIDKTAEEQPEGGTSEGQAIQEVPDAKERAETRLVAKVPAVTPDVVTTAPAVTKMPRADLGTGETREDLQAAGYRAMLKSSDLHEYGYTIVHWFNPKTKDQVVEYVPQQRAGQKFPKGRPSWVARTYAQQVEIHKELGAPVLPPGGEVGPEKPSEPGWERMPEEQRAKGTKRPKAETIQRAEFLEWFGDWRKGEGSKVTKDNGEPEEEYGLKPMKMFHGTPTGGFRTFSRDKDKGGNIYGKGFYFTADHGIAQEYTKKDADEALASTTEIQVEGKKVEWMDAEQVKDLLKRSGFIHKGRIKGKWSGKPGDYEELVGLVSRKGYGHRNANWDFNILHAVAEASDDQGRVHMDTLIERFWNPNIPRDAQRHGQTALEDVLPHGGVQFIKNILLTMGLKLSNAVGPKAQVFEVYLNIRNPIDMDAEVDEAKLADMIRTHMVHEAKRRGYTEDNWQDKLREDIAKQKARIKSIEEAHPHLVKVTAEERARIEAEWEDARDRGYSYSDGEMLHSLDVERRWLELHERELKMSWQEFLEQPAFSGEYIKQILGHYRSPEDGGSDFVALQKQFPDAFPEDYDPDSNVIPVTPQALLAVKQFLVDRNDTYTDHDTGEEHIVNPLLHRTPRDVLTWGDVQYILTDGQFYDSFKNWFRDWAESAGYDGLHHTGGWNVGTKDHDVWVAWKPEQIKATNAWHFDSSSDNIYDGEREPEEGWERMPEPGPAVPETKPEPEPTPTEKPEPPPSPAKPDPALHREAQAAAKLLDRWQTKAMLRVLQDEGAFVRADGRLAQAQGATPTYNEEALVKLAEVMPALVEHGLVTAEVVPGAGTIYKLTELGRVMDWHREYMKRRLHVMTQRGRDTLAPKPKTVLKPKSKAQLKALAAKADQKAKKHVQAGEQLGLDFQKQRAKLTDAISDADVEENAAKAAEELNKPKAEPQEPKAEPTPYVAPAGEVSMAGSVLEVLQDLAEKDLLSEELAGAVSGVAWSRTVKVGLGPEAREQLKGILGEQIKAGLRKMQSAQPDIRQEGRQAVANCARVMLQLDPGWEEPGKPGQPGKAAPKAKAAKRKTGGKGSRKKLAKEVGDHVWGTRADKWAINNPSDLDGMSPQDQAKVCTKANLLPKWDPDDELAAGKEPELLVLRKAFEACIGAKAGDNEETRKLYVEGIDYIARSLDSMTTAADMADFLEDWRQLAIGHKKVGEFTEDERGKLYDEWMESKGTPVEWDWKKRREQEKVVRAAYEHQQALWKKWRLGGMEPADKEAYEVAMSEYQRLDKELDNKGRWGERSKIPDILAWKFGVSKFDISTGYIGDGRTTVHVKDPDLGASIRENHYARLMAAMGDRFIKVVASKYKRPKVYRDAKNAIDNWERQDLDDDTKVKVMYAMLEAKRKKGEKRKPFRWEREVPGEINRKGGRAVATADPKRFAKEFGFANVQFGHWVSEEDAESHLKGAHGALLDLADIIGVDPKVISLGGKLSIGFGARGGGKASAHYESGHKIINLTKKAGGGSLAHEWAHAMDHLASLAANKSGKAKQFMSSKDIEGLSPEVQKAMQGVMDAIYGSEFHKHAMVLSPGSDGYYARPHEMFARAFEAYIEDTLDEEDRKSSYLVAGTKVHYATGTRKVRVGVLRREEDVVDPQPYPQGEERKEIGAAIKSLLAVMAKQNTLEKSLRALGMFFGNTPVDLRPRFTIYPDGLVKAKYTRRWKGSDGKWRYEYDEPKNRRPTKAAAPQGSYLDQGKRPVQGDKVWILAGQINQEPMEAVVSSMPEQAYYGKEFYVDVKAADGSTRRVSTSLMFSHKPQRTTMRDEYGETKVWKSQVAYQVLTADELLQKGDPTGGTYYKRVPVKKPGAKRKWRYFYNKDDYDKRDDRHVSGNEAAKAHLAGSVLKCVEKAGGNCGPESLAALVKRHGAKQVAETLRESVKGGRLTFKKGKFSLGKRGAKNDAVDPAKRQKGDRRGAGRKPAGKSRPKR